MYKSFFRLVLLALIVMALMIFVGAVGADTAASQPPGYEIVQSSPLNFSGGGWGGWSCPAGKVVLGGGVSGVKTETSRPAGPNSVWPHYTYGANEYGWVARSVEAGTATIWMVCADAPAGYQLIESSGFNYNGSGGWAGWSCPAGKVVLGGGVENLLARSSRPAGPNSVWPHYTFGANEYGWVAQDGGVATTGSKVALICSDPLPGYQIVESNPQNFGPTGAAGWSCPSDTFVTGGGVENLIASSSRPAGPGTITDFGYTYGPTEYGWLANNGENVGTTGSLIVPICIEAPAPPPSVVPVGDDVVCDEGTVEIVIDDVQDLYGYEFIVEYDGGVVSADGSFVNTWFDPSGNGFPGPASPVNWQADCSSGECRFAYTRGAPDNEIATSDPEVIASIDFTSLLPSVPNTFDVTVKDVKLTDKDSFEIPGAVGGSYTVEVCGTATVSGQIALQGRPQPSSPFSGAPSVFEVKLIGPFGTFTASAPSGVSYSDGTYSVSGVKYTSGGTAYTIQADHSVYLKAEKTLSVTGDLVGESTTLKGGDATDNGKILAGDLACVGGQFGSTSPTACSGGPPSTADLNNDSIVNIQDLSLLAGNYGLEETQGW